MNPSLGEAALSRSLQRHLECFSKIPAMERDILRGAEALVQTLRGGGKILSCGNGGSAADGQHFAAEIVGRFYKNRRALPAIALSTDTSIITAVGNDYGFDRVFARQVEALANPADALILLSTSGNSPNLLNAAHGAWEKGLITIGLLGKDGGELKAKVDIPVIAPSWDTARIQEIHGFIIHLWAEIVESSLCGDGESEDQ